MRPITAEAYSNLDRTSDLHGVQRELERVINAQPTQIGPPDRAALMSALLDDLEDKESAPWTKWPSTIYLLALTALKSLGRNPVGSTIIIERLRTLLHHTSLPLPPPASPFSHPCNDPEHPTAHEALKVLANALVLHDAARRKFAEMGGGIAVSKALKDVHPSTERLFLLGRIGFLVTIDRREVVRRIVDDEGLVDSLVLHLSSTSAAPTNFAALAELLKLTNNVIRFYQSSEDTWTPILDPLLAPVLTLLHTIPSNDLTPPLTNTIHVLLSIPFSTDLLPAWSQVPPRSPRQVSPSSTFDKLSSLIIGQAPRISKDSIRESISLSADRHQSGSSGSAKRCSPTPPKTDEPTALPARLLKVLDTFFAAHLPPSRSVDDERQDRVVLDETLPPTLLLLSRAAAASPEIKAYIRSRLLPSALDRSTAAGPLEKRPGLLGTLLRLMQGAAQVQSRDTAGELLWVICDSDPATLSKEIGYGNAAGLLFRKGLGGPPEAKIEEITEDEQARPIQRHPITSIQESDPEDDPLAGLTQEEKEREAERLFVLLDRMERNPVISASTGAKDIMRQKLERGELEDDQPAEERERQEREKRDEEEAMADLRRYKDRMGKR